MNLLNKLLGKPRVWDTLDSIPHHVKVVNRNKTKMYFDGVRWMAHDEERSITWRYPALNIDGPFTEVR